MDYEVTQEETHIESARNIAPGMGGRYVPLKEAMRRCESIYYRSGRHDRERATSPINTKEWLGATQVGRTTDSATELICRVGRARTGEREKKDNK